MGTVFDAANKVLVNASSCAWPAPLGSQHQAPVAMTPTLAIVVVAEALTPRPAFVICPIHANPRRCGLVFGPDSPPPWGVRLQ